MTDMVLLQQEHFLCENKDVDVLMYQINGKVFFNATNVWKNFGSPDVNSLDVYLRTDSAKKIMLQIYGNLKGFDELLNEINNLSQNLVKQGFKFRASNPTKATQSAKAFEPFKDLESFLAATNSLRLKKFDPQLENGFVHSIKGAQGATFLCYDLFLDYCTHLSTQLKLEIFETFKKVGNLSQLEGKALADVLQKKAADALSKLSPYTPQVVSTIVREEVKEKTKNLHQSIQNVYHLYVPPTKENNMYAYIHDQINTNLFGATSIKMHKVIELQRNSSVKLRDCMTDKAIRLLEQVESSVHVFLSDCYDDNAMPSLDELDSVIKEACAAALSVARRRKDDFLLLQLAVERDYDLLVKNADCVKNVGVIARPHEICEKADLIALNPSVQLLTTTKRQLTAKQKPTSKPTVLIEPTNVEQENLQLPLFDLG